MATPSQVTAYLCKLVRKNSHVSIVSPSTMEKVIDTIFWFPSCATTTKSAPLYFL
ncbi:uncharacterized protein DS421_19g660280 [Arachis hypogaea]|uniref:Uncharacterized protein n=1 Tax=Arachis hypogaea TaxID=3818 RepID=A0A6B9VC79_ARAHY|nr:uncharacterized protein DS421_19g660280 [Arachis hypogaea]